MDRCRRGKVEDFSGRDINVVFTLGKNENKNYDEEVPTTSDEAIPEEIKTKNTKEPRLREVNVNNSNPFRNLDTEEEKKIAEHISGSPIYYKDYNSGGYVVAKINES